MYYCFHKIIKQHSYFNIEWYKKEMFIENSAFSNRNKLYFKIY